MLKVIYVEIMYAATYRGKYINMNCIININNILFTFAENNHRISLE